MKKKRTKLSKDLTKEKRQISFDPIRDLEYIALDLQKLQNVISLLADVDEKSADGNKCWSYAMWHIHDYLEANVDKLNDTVKLAMCSA